MKTKTLKTLFAILSLVAGMSVATTAQSAVPGVEAVGRAAFDECPVSSKVKIYHSDKIVFMIGNGNLQPLIAADFGPLNALPRLTELDVKIRDNPAAVANLKAKLLFFLGAANTAANRGLISIRQVTYATSVCPKIP
jgi:hypothetical protein